MTPVRPLAIAGLTALGLTGLLPTAAVAAPAPCESAERYAAQSGAQLLRVNKPDRLTGVVVGDARSALIAQGTVNAAAVTRMLDGADRPVLQQAPPAHQTPTVRTVKATARGPLKLGPGTLTAQATWDPAMACGRTVGTVTRAETALTSTSLLDHLVATDSRSGSVSTTALEHSGTGARTVAAATMSGRTFDLFDGAVQVKILRAPHLETRMSTKDGGTVSYRPAIVEVSGEKLRTRTLRAAGDSLDIPVGHPTDPDRTGFPADDLSSDPPTSSDTDTSRPATKPSGSGPSGGVEESAGTGVVPDPLGELTTGAPGGLTASKPLPLPEAPGVPPVAGEPETTPADDGGTTVHISLGEVRQATVDRAVAAKVTAITLAVTRAPTGDPGGPGYDDAGTGVVLDLDLGLLEAASVAPDGGVRAAVSGRGGSLPITGPRVDALVLAGFGLLVAGATALFFGLRKGKP